MQFKNPEILYFLFLLIIPILVHLFQLRRFKKQEFTNVKLLKELEVQTRKSATIKKWLLLVTRLLLLTALIFAFAQPFFKAKDFDKKNNELIINLVFAFLVFNLKSCGYANCSSCFYLRLILTKSCTL
jgi:hypothetical protein